MSNRRSPRGALCVALVAVVFCRSALAAEAVSVTPVSASDRAGLLAQIETVGRRGFLYEVTRDAPRGTTPDDGAGATPTRPAIKRLFLYGTIHVGRIDSEPFNAAVIRALQASRRLALEADPSDELLARELALRLGRYEPGDGLQRHVTPALMARVAAFGARHGMSRERVDRFRPWLLANMVAARRIDDSGLAADLGSEHYLAGFARSAAMPIVEVEGLESQLRLLAATPDAVQDAELDEALGDDADGKAAADGRALFDCWLTGDAAAGDRLIDALHREARDKVFERYFVDTLIDARNRRMADAAEQDFEQPGNTFFAVGALHLFGELGLIRELERRGYRVSDMQPPLAAR